MRVVGTRERDSRRRKWEEEGGLLVVKVELDNNDVSIQTIVPYRMSWRG
jgi:hypothetical protein